MSNQPRFVLILSLAFFSSMPGCAGSRLEQNKQIVLEQARAYNDRDVDAFRATMTPDLRRHCQATPDINVRSADDFVAFAESDWQMFPDGRLEVDRMAAEGDLVGIFGRYTGTQTEAMGPFPASDKQVELDFGGVFRIENDRIAEIWITWDNLTALTQLGHWPPPRGSSGEQSRGTSPPGVREQYLRYMEASNAHDIEALASMTADDIVWHLGQYVLRGKPEALLPHESDAVMNTALEVRDLRVDGRIVECEVIERNDMLRAAGIERWRHFARYVFDETGRVVLKEPWRTSPDDAEVARRFKPYREWRRVNHPESVPDFDDMADVWGSKPATRSRQLMQAWVAAGRPGAIDDERSLLNATESAWVEAIHAGDRERIFSYWTDDAIIYAAGGLVVEGKPAILDFVRASRDRGTTLQIWTEPDKTVVSETGDIGYTIGTYEFRRTEPDGTEVRMAGRHLCTWRKSEDGAWRCMLEIHSPSGDGQTAWAPVKSLPTPASGSGVVYVPASTLLPCQVSVPEDLDPDRPYDIVIGLHGFGSTPEDFATIASPFVDAGMLFAAPQAPTAFLADDRIGYDWDRAHDEPDGSPIRVSFGRASANYITDVVQVLRRRYNINRVYLLGFSQGGAYAYVVGVHRPDVTAGIIAVGMGFEAGWFQEGALEAGSELPVLIMHSRDDQRIPFAFTEASAETLRDLGYDVTLHEYEGGHRITDAVLDRAVEWLLSR